MSMCYSVAEGHGVYLNKLDQYLNGNDVDTEIIKSVINEDVFEVTCS